MPTDWTSSYTNNHAIPRYQQAKTRTLLLACNLWAKPGKGKLRFRLFFAWLPRSRRRRGNPLLPCYWETDVWICFNSLLESHSKYAGSRFRCRAECRRSGNRESWLRDIVRILGRTQIQLSMANWCGWGCEAQHESWTCEHRMYNRSVMWVW